MKAPGTAVCPECGVFHAKGNTITEDTLPYVEGIWIIFRFSCGLHYWARPKDKEQEKRMIRW